MRFRLASIFLLAPLVLAGCVGSLRHDLARAFAMPQQGVSPPLVARRHLEPFDVERAAESDDARLRTPSQIASEAMNGDAAETISTSDDPILFGLKSAVILAGARSVGSTSLVLRLPLDGGLTAAFKPDTKKHRGRYRGEVAAYRLARGLGLDGVPPSVPRAAKMAALLASIGADKTKRKLLAMGLPVAGASGSEDTIPGAMIAWLPAIKPLPLEKQPLATAFGQWLAQTSKTPPIELRLPRGQAAQVLAAKPLASQISSMIAFDHVTGNRDRFSGNNVMIDETGTRLIYLDNNLAFDATIDVAQTKKRAHLLSRVEKFSRRLITALRALDHATLATMIGQDHLGAPLLAPAQLDACLVRRDELLAHVDRLIAKFGDERVLAFE